MTIETMQHSDDRDQQLLALKNALVDILSTGINDLAAQNKNKAEMLQACIVGGTHRLEMTLTFPEIRLDVFISENNSDPDTDAIWLFCAEEEPIEKKKH